VDDGFFIPIVLLADYYIDQPRQFRNKLSITFALVLDILVAVGLWASKGVYESLDGSSFCAALDWDKTFFLLNLKPFGLAKI
jgi:hypothetical protein